MILLIVANAPISLIIERQAMKQTKVSIGFDKDIAIFEEDCRIVTLPPPIDGEKNLDSLSKEFTSDDEDFEDNDLESDNSDRSVDADERGPVGEEYIVCMKVTA